MNTTATPPTSPAPGTDPANFRDLGGIAVADGRIASGRLFRSDDLCLIADDYAAAIESDNGITSVIDLRSSREARATGRGPLALSDIGYHHLPLGGDIAVDSAADLVTLDDLADWYVRLVTRSAATLVSAIALIGVERGATVFHCAAGKDRTGVLAAAVLSLLGASDTVIADDYARTADVLDAIVHRLATASGTPDMARLLEREERPVVLTAEREVMLAALRTLREQHGSIAALLTTAGLTPAHVDALRSRLVDAA